MNKILIVDDIETNRKMIGKMLGLIKAGEIIEAVNGEEAISKFKSESPDLILMDIDMPVMDGFQSTAEIKKLSGDNYIPVIFVTALSSEPSLGYALASGGDDFISKPVNVEVLESKINAHLRIRELNQQLNSSNKKLCYEQELIEYFFKNALQKSYLNKDIIKYHMSSMSTFNGDLLLIERCPQGGLYILMGDFTGHGLTAAMGTLPAAMIFFKMTGEAASISDIASELNHQLHTFMPTGMFFSATLIKINAHCDRISVWAGGMPESYLLTKSGDLKTTIQSKHMPLGILNKDEFDAEVRIYDIEKDDKIYLYSDGIIEAWNANNEMFGAHRLKEALTRHGDDRFEKVLNELKTFVATNDQTDDITLLEVNCNEIPAAEKNRDQ